MEKEKTGKIKGLGIERERERQGLHDIFLKKLLRNQGKFACVIDFFRFRNCRL